MGEKKKTKSKIQRGRLFWLWKYEWLSTCGNKTKRNKARVRRRERKGIAVFLFGFFFFITLFSRLPTADIVIGLFVMNKSNTIHHRVHHRTVIPRQHILFIFGASLYVLRRTLFAAKSLLSISVDRKYSSKLIKIQPTKKQIKKIWITA